MNNIIRCSYHDAAYRFPNQWYSRHFELLLMEINACEQGSSEKVDCAFVDYDGRLMISTICQGKIFWEIWLVFDANYDRNGKMTVFLADGVEQLFSELKQLKYRGEIPDIYKVRDLQLGMQYELRLRTRPQSRGPQAVNVMKNVKEWIRNMENMLAQRAQQVRNVFQRQQEISQRSGRPQGRFFRYVNFNAQNRECIHVVLSDRAYNAIISETLAYDRTETGGVLIGHIFRRVWYVMEVIPPGIFTTNSSTFFQLDTNFVNYLAGKIGEVYAHPPTILGFWHRHPGSMDFFSSQDEETLIENVRASKHGMLSMLVNIDPELRMTFYHANNNELMSVRYDFGDEYFPEGLLDLATPDQLLRRPYVREGNGHLAIKPNQVLKPENLPRTLQTQPIAPVQPVEPEPTPLSAQASEIVCPIIPVQPAEPEQPANTELPAVPEGTPTLDEIDQPGWDEAVRVLRDYMLPQEAQDGAKHLLIVADAGTEGVALADGIVRVLRRNGLIADDDPAHFDMSESVHDPLSQAEKMTLPYPNIAVIINHVEKIPFSMPHQQLLNKVLELTESMESPPTLLLLCNEAVHAMLPENVVNHARCIRVDHLTPQELMDCLTQKLYGTSLAKELLTARPDAQGRYAAPLLRCMERIVQLDWQCDSCTNRELIARLADGLKAHAEEGVITRHSFPDGLMDESWFCNTPCNDEHDDDDDD